MQQDGYESLVGASATLRRTVTAADTAQSLGSGDVPVLATPRLLAWLEAATVMALEALPEQLTSVGARVVLEHRRPNAVGDVVVCTARVTAVAGRSVELTVAALWGEEGTVVAQGTVVRAVVDRSRFLEGLGRPS